MKKLLTLTAVGTVLVCSDALASGFNLKEQSAAAQGNAFAGATAGAEDISYSFFNPAGLTRHKNVGNIFQCIRCGCCRNRGKYFSADAAAEFSLCGKRRRY